MKTKEEEFQEILRKKENEFEEKDREKEEAFEIILQAVRNECEDKMTERENLLEQQSTRRCSELERELKEAREEILRLRIQLQKERVLELSASAQNKNRSPDKRHSLASGGRSTENSIEKTHPALPNSRVLRDTMSPARPLLPLSSSAKANSSSNKRVLKNSMHQNNVSTEVYCRNSGNSEGAITRTLPTEMDKGRDSSGLEGYPYGIYHDEEEAQKQSQFEKHYKRHSNLLRKMRLGIQEERKGARHQHTLTKDRNVYSSVSSGCSLSTVKMSESAYQNNYGGSQAYK